MRTRLLLLASACLLASTADLGAQLYEYTMAMGPKGRIQAYKAYQDRLDVRDLYVTDLKSNENRSLSTQLDADDTTEYLAIGPKGKQVLYSAIRRSDAEGGSAVYELYVADVKTGKAVKINDPLSQDSSIEGDFRFGPRGKYAYYRSYKGTIWEATEGDIFQVDLKTMDVEKLTETSPGSYPYEFKIDEKGRSLVYPKYDIGTGVTDLYHVDLKTGESSKVNPDLEAPRSVSSYELQAKGSFIVYLADIGEHDNVFEPYLAPIKTVGSGEAIKITSDLPQTASASTLLLDEKGRSVAFRADIDEDGKIDLYVSSLKKLGSELKVSGDLQVTGDVSGFRFDPKGKLIVYNADADLEGKFELFLTDVKTGTARKISETLPPEGDVFDFRFDPKGRAVVYEGDKTNDNREELFYYEIKKDDSRTLVDQFPEGGEVLNFTIGPKGKQVFFTGDTVTDDKYELSVVDVKSEEITKLNDELTAEGDVSSSFKVDPKGRNVVYKADQSADGINEVFLVDVKAKVKGKAGGAKKVNGTLTAGGSVY